MSANGQSFLFLPRPERPPVLVGGGATHAFARIAKYADGWMPGRIEPEALAPLVAELRTQMTRAGRELKHVVVLTHLPVDDAGASAERVAAFAEAGATGIAHFTRYEDFSEFAQAGEALASLTQTHS